MDLFAEREYNPAKWRVPETLPDLSNVTRIGFDCESTGLHPHADTPVGIVVAVPSADVQPFAGGSLQEWLTHAQSCIKSYYLPFAHQAGGNLDPNIVRRWAKEQLVGKQLVGSYIKIDAHFMHNWGVDLEAQRCTCHDVQHRAALLDENQFTYGLDALAKRDLGLAKKDVPFKKDDLWRMPSSEVGEYAEYDGVLPLLLDHYYWPRICKDELQRVVALEDALTYPIVSMERMGARIDVAKLLRWQKEIDAEVSRLLQRIAARTGLRVDPNKAKDLEWLFVALKLPLPKAVNPKGEEYVSITDDVLKAIEHDVIADTRRARQLLSLKSRYIDKYPRSLRDSDVLRYALHQLRSDKYGTVSGRFSSSGIDDGPDSEGCNIQQVMKVEKQREEIGDDYIVRELFIPADGKKWGSADAMQIEFRLFAHDANSQRLLKFYEKDPLMDFHQGVADMIGRKRSFSKQFNFAMLYGMGLEKTANALGITLDEAKAVRKQYEDEFPEARKLSNEAQEKVRERGYVKTLLGRRRRYPADEKGRRIGMHAALNGRIQGSAADVMKLKIIEVYRERETIGFDMRFVVHDEFDGDLDPDPKYAQRFKDLLDTQSLKLRVPILWDVNVDENWRLSE